MGDAAIVAFSPAKRLSFDYCDFSVLSFQLSVTTGGKAKADS
jgi:hypothetical protein